MVKLPSENPRVNVKEVGPQVDGQSSAGGGGLGGKPASVSQIACYSRQLSYSCYVGRSVAVGVSRMP